MKKPFLSKNIFIGIIGNVYEHYDNTIFALIIPFIAPLFFPKQSVLNALIFSYGLLNIGVISKPIGAIIFGYKADNLGCKKTLSITLLGSAITCLLFSIIPTYSKIGIFAPIILIMIKALQSFFSAGEITTGAIFVLENSSKKSIVSSIYDASSILGIFLASASVFIFSFFNLISTYWRILFLVGVFIAFIGLYIRKTSQNTSIVINHENSKITDILKIIKNNFSSFCLITLISGFSYSIYYFSIIFFNGYIPLISNITKTEALKTNTLLLIIDFCVLPLFGMLANKISKEKTMLLSSLIITIISIPLFSILKDASIFTATLVRVIFVLIGVLFSAPMHHLAYEIAPAGHRSIIITASYSIGSQAIGIPSCSIGLLLYKKTGLVFAPAIYLTICAFLSFIAIYVYSIKKEQLKELVN